MARDWTEYWGGTRGLRRTGEGPGDATLTATGVSLSFGGVKALDGVDLTIGGDELVAVIGPNGAGKTSLLNCFNGFYRPQSGQLTFAGADIARLPPHAIARRGLARTFQGTHLFAELSVVSNLLVGRSIHQRQGLLSAFFYYPWTHREESEHRRAAEEIIEFLGLERIRHQPVGSLSYGLRKRVDLGRALAMQPRMLVMDEPMAGMNVEEKEDMARFILDVREAWRIPVLLVEHDMGVVMDLADRIAVLDFGRKIAEGPPSAIQRDEAVRRAYLGAPVASDAA